MTPNRPAPLVIATAALWLALGGSAALGQGMAPVPVDPSELSKREDLVGKSVVVDDRVALFQLHPGRDFDQIFLKRARDVPFELPGRLRFKKSPQSQAARLTGVLRREGDRWWCDVTQVELLPADLDRLNSAVATIPRVDFEKRLAWVYWAEARAKAFDDPTLLDRARRIETEVLRDEAERPGSDPAGHWLGLADRARKRGIDEPEPSALAHRGFRAALPRAGDPAALKGLVRRIEAFFPQAASPTAGPPPADMERRLRSYAADPADAYRSASEPERRALDRRLWVDASSKRVERQAAEDPDDALSLAEEVSVRIPERADLARSLFDKALDAASTAPDRLTRVEVERLAAIFRDRLGAPERAEGLLRDWLSARRRKLSGTRDAEGRINLAGEYERLLGDRGGALDLLREAREVDPDSPQITAAYLARGFRKVGGRWVEGSAGGAGGAAAGAPAEGPSDAPDGAGPPDALRAGSLLNATPDEVRTRMGGRPTRRVVSATRGQIVEQWVYSDPRENRYVTFLQRAGASRPTVISYFSVPRGPNRGAGVGN